MYNHNKAQQSKNRVHISWDILYKLHIFMFHCCIMLKIKFVASITTSTTTTTTTTPTTNLHWWNIDEWDTWYPDICLCMVIFIAHTIFFASWPLILISHWAPVKWWSFREWKRSFIEPIFQYTPAAIPTLDGQFILGCVGSNDHDIFIVVHKFVNCEAGPFNVGGIVYNRQPL